MTAFSFMPQRRRILTLAPFLGLLWGCSDLKMDSEELNARTTAPQAGANCAACHAHPPRDINHTFHLFMTDTTHILENRPITCMHCHSKSIASHPVTYLDSIFLDNGVERRGLDYPNDPELRTFPLLRVENVIRIRPRPMPGRPGYVGPKEWMTALAHMNGKVDIDFDSSSIDTARFHGVKANYSVQNLTCSAVACHPNHNAYRWPIPSKGLPILRGE